MLIYIEYHLESFIAFLTFHNYCATQKYALRNITGHFRQCQNQGVLMLTCIYFKNKWESHDEIWKI